MPELQKMKMVTFWCQTKTNLCLPGNKSEVRKCCMASHMGWHLPVPTKSRLTKVVAVQK